MFKPKCSESVTCPSHLPERFQSFMKPLSRPQKHRWQVFSNTVKLHILTVLPAELPKIGYPMLPHFKLPDDEHLHRCF